MARSSKKSAAITLVLIGSVSLTACSESRTAQRSLYRSPEDCYRDWGQAPLPDGVQPCQSRSGGVYSPWYSFSNSSLRYYEDNFRREGTVPADRPIARNGGRAIFALNTTSTTIRTSSSGGSSRIRRSGFGSSARSRSGGRSG